MEISSTFTDTLKLLQERISTLRSKHHPEKRIIIALAGTPGSGKSSIAAALLQHLRQSGVQDVAIVPMDGFHYPRSVLATFPDPNEAFRRRGAPFTFDAEACIGTVRQLRQCKVAVCNDPSQRILLPSFGHAIQDPVACDIQVSSTTRVVILEGNYTMLSQHPWSQLAPLVHDKWFVRVPREIAKARIVKRHLLTGVEKIQEEAMKRAEESDLPNGDLLLANMVTPDLVIRNG